MEGQLPFALQGIKPMGDRNPLNVGLTLLHPHPLILKNASPGGLYGTHTMVDPLCAPLMLRKPFARVAYPEDKSIV